MKVASINKLAAALGVSRPTIDKYIRRGVIKRGPEGFDVEICGAAIAVARDPAQPKATGKKGTPANMASGGVAGGNGDSPDPAGGSVWEQLNRAKTRKEQATAEEKELNLQVRKSVLVERADIVRVLGEKLTAFNNRLLLMPDKLAPLVAPNENVLECRLLVENEVREVIKSLQEISKIA